MKFQTKAERAFHAKTAAAIAAGDWAGVERLYGQYGAYLELTEVEPALPAYDPDTDPLRGDAEARARDDAYWAPVERETS